MTEQEAIQLFKCLADKSRLQILKSLAQEDMDVERLAGRLQLTSSTVSFHLKKLAEAGAVTARKSQYYMIYSLRRELFETSILRILQEQSDEAAQQAQRDAEYRQKVIDSFFRYGKLKSIPAQRKKKRIILEELVKSFREEQPYTEREVNEIIGAMHEDYCTLRRELVGEGLMVRDGGIYRRVRQEDSDPAAESQFPG